VVAGPWIGTVTRLDGQGRPFVRARALAGEQEYGPLLRARGAGGWSGGAGSPVTELALVVGDTVLISAVEGQRSVFVVLSRLV